MERKREEGRGRAREHDGDRDTKITDKRNPDPILSSGERREEKDLTP